MKIEIEVSDDKATREKAAALAEHQAHSLIDRHEDDENYMKVASILFAFAGALRK